MSSAAATATAATAAIDTMQVSLHERYLATAKQRQLDPSPANILALQEAHADLVLHQLAKAAATGAFDTRQSLIDDLKTDPESPEGQHEIALELAARDAWLKAHNRPADDLSDASHRFGDVVAERFHGDKRAFLKMLRLTGSVVGGSLPLQAVIKKRWPSSDLDLYIPDNRRDALPMWQGFLIAAGYSVERTRVKAAPYMKAKNPRLGNSINSVITYRGSGVHCTRIIQLIHCKSIPRVLNAVDFSCTTFFHNGERILSLDDPTLARHNVTFLRYPLEELNNYEAKERIIKYGAQRGFLILQKGNCESVLGSSVWNERIAAIDAERDAKRVATATATATATAISEYTESAPAWEQELPAEELAEVEAAHAAVQQSLAAAAAAVPPSAEFAPADVRAALTVLNAPIHRI